MQPRSVVLFQSDARLAQALAAILCNHFHAVHFARSIEELQSAISKHRAAIAIFDVEGSGLSEVERLHRDFPALSIVCTHRLADEDMWTAALNAGASDICPASDTDAIVLSALRIAALTRSAAA